jgi:hypothetical protein
VGPEKPYAPSQRRQQRRRSKLLPAGAASDHAKKCCGMDMRLAIRVERVGNPADRTTLQCFARGCLLSLKSRHD